MKRTIEKALGIIYDYYHEENIYEPIGDVINRLKEWYIKIGIEDEETLAALAMSGNYEKPMTTQEILNIREFFFPSTPLEFDNFSIEEIELALWDKEWR